MKKKIISVLLSINTMLLIISGSISAVILFRPFYYWHIRWLKLVDSTGYSVEVMKQAYDEMMDFCIGLSSTFSTGALAYSTEGMDHFVDCKKLFILCFVILAISAAVISLYFIFRKKVEYYHFKGHDFGYWGCVLMIVLFAVISALASTDFNRAFVIFHKIFFPGKDNWLFNPRTDQIINILPETFFMNCAIVIVLLIIISSFLIVRNDLKKRYKIK